MTTLATLALLSHIALALLLWLLIGIYGLTWWIGRLTTEQKSALSTARPKLWAKLYWIAGFGPNQPQMKRAWRTLKALARFEQSQTADVVLDWVAPDDEITLTSPPLLPPVLPPSSRPPPPPQLVSKPVKSERYSLHESEIPVEVEVPPPKGK